EIALRRIGVFDAQAEAALRVDAIDARERVVVHDQRPHGRVASSDARVALGDAADAGGRERVVFELDAIAVRLLDVIELVQWRALDRVGVRRRYGPRRKM